MKIRTSLHHWHEQHGAKLIEWDGWQVVACYADTRQEVEAARTGIGIADISCLAKFSLRGPGMRFFVKSWDLDSASIQVRAVAALRSLKLPAHLCWLSPDHGLLLGATPSPHDLKACLVEQPIVQTNVTSTYAGFLVLGPRLEEVLSRLTSLDVRPTSFPSNSCAETALARVEAVLVKLVESRLPSIRIYVPWDSAEYVWERLLEAGRDRPITPIGFKALASYQPLAICFQDGAAVR